MALSTKEQLLQLVDDIEIISKELLENVLAPKGPGQKAGTMEHSQLAELLVAKDKELKETLKQAEEQAEIQKKMDALQAEVEKQDQDIRQLQNKLKEAEHILATAIYQAKQKLNSIAKGSSRPTSSEELIKYAHRISSSNAVAAPHNWQQGDPRRPYPTDIEMRLGFLGRLSSDPLSGNMMVTQQPGSLGEMAPPRTPHDQPSTQAGSYTWQHSGDIKPNIGGSAAVAMDSKGHKDSEDVEVMSSDSSSSSSSDSQ